MEWRVAESLEQLLEQVNEIAPNRSKISDGSIGDPNHASRVSDHNPHCGPGVVTARDITHDPDKGADMGQITEALRESRDPRIKYVIYNGRMFSSYQSGSHPAWSWRPYTGINAHEKHAHISVNCDGQKDSRTPWTIRREEWDEVATKQEIKEAIREVVREVVSQELDKTRKELAVGKSAAKNGYNSDNVNLKAVLEKK